MGLIVKTKTYVDNDAIIYSDLNANWDALYTLVNGNIDNANISPTAAIATSKINATFPTGAIVGTTDTQTLQNKILSTGTGIVLGSDATGDLYYRAVSGLLARLGVGSAGQVLGIAAGLPAWVAAASLKVKVGNFTHGMGSTGNQAITGVGFQPKAIIVLTNVDSNSLPDLAVGFSDGTTSYCVELNVSSKSQLIANLISLADGTGNQMTGALASLDADGFTITWSKTGTPGGTTINGAFLAIG